MGVLRREYCDVEAGVELEGLSPADVVRGTVVGVEEARRFPRARYMVQVLFGPGLETQVLSIANLV